MSHFQVNPFDYERQGISRECLNCHSTDALSEVLLNDGGMAWLCDDCAEEEARQEARACELVNARPGLLCEEREQLIETAVSTNWLVNKLVAHDMTCTVCGTPRKGMQSEIGHTAAVEVRA